MTIKKNISSQIKSVFLKAINSTKPKIIFKKNIRNYLPSSKIIKVVAIGKAASSMVERIIELDIAKEGILVTNSENFKKINGFSCFKTGHPLPDEVGLDAAVKVEHFLDQLNENHHLLLLLSGGGSSLLPAPAKGISLQNKIYINSKLLESGININEVNAVRRLFSRLKGGRLLKRAYPATVTQLIFSDVMDDSLETIASGVCAPDPYTINDVKKILTKTKLIKEPFILDYIKRCELNKNLLPFRENHKIFKNVKSYILANNKTCLDKAIEIMKKKYNFISPIDVELSGEASFTGIKLAKWFISRKTEKKFFTALGGETTVTLKDIKSGKGGRCQELALSFSIYMKKHFKEQTDWLILAAGTDGRDGPTDAAGAIVTSESNFDINEANSYLSKNNSYNFLLKNGLLLKTGGTNTNLGDLVFLVML